MSLVKAVARGLVWTSLESFALTGLSLLSLVVFARYLSAEQLGVGAMALAIVQVLTLPVEVLFHDVLIQRKELRPSHVSSAFTLSVILGAGLCGGCWLLADRAEQLLHEPELGSALKWMSLSLIGTSFGSVLIAMQRRRLEFRTLALRSLGGRAGSAAIAIVLAVQGAGVWSLVAQQVLMVCLGTATLWALAEERPRFGLTWQPTRQLLRFGWLSLAQNLLNVGILRGFMLLLGAFHGTTLLGIVSLAFRGLDMLRDLLGAALWQVAMPAFATLQDDTEALFTGYTRSVQLTTLVTFPVFVGLAVCAPEVLLVAFGPQWTLASPYFVLIALLALPFFVRFYASALLNAIGHPGARLAEFIAQALFVAGGMLALGRFSAWHAMAVWGLRLCVSIPVDMWMLRRVAGMPYARQLRGPLVPLLASAGMAGVVLLAKLYLLDTLAPQLRLWPLVVLGAASYAALIMLLDRKLARQLVQLARQSVLARSGA